MRTAILVLAALIVFPAYAVADDAALIEKLVSGSPWKGENVAQGNMGAATYDVTFQKKGDNLAGEIQNFSILNFARTVNGPIRFITVKNGVVEFENAASTRYQLKLSDDGKLKGTATSQNGRLRTHATLAPVSK